MTWPKPSVKSALKVTFPERISLSPCGLLDLIFLALQKASKKSRVLYYNPKRSPPHRKSQKLIAML